MSISNELTKLKTITHWQTEYFDHMCALLHNPKSTNDCNSVLYCCSSGQTESFTDTKLQETLCKNIYNLCLQKLKKP